MATAVAIGLTVASTAASVAAAKQQADYENASLARNAERAKAMASMSLLTGAAGASEAVAAGSKMVSEGRAAAGASGFTVESPGVVNMLATTRETSALDAETIKNNALREALGYEAQASSFSAKRSAVNSRLGWQITTSMLGGASKVAGQMYDSGMLTSKSKADPLYDLGQAEDYTYYDTLPTVERGG